MKTSPISTQLIHDLKFLTSKETEGRVSGSKGAKMTATYIANVLSNLGILPAGDDGYFSSLNIYAARLNGNVTLKVGEKKLQHRTDFGEISKYSNPTGNSVHGELMIVNDGEEINPSRLKGKVVLVPEKPDKLDLAATVKGAEELGVAAMLIEGGEPKWFVKSLHGSRENSIPVFHVRKSIVNEIAQLDGEIVQIELPLISENRTCQNVLGLLPGKDTTKILVLSAHYDHLGDDPNGHRFPGAVDNASGVSVLLETARKLSGQTLPFTILFAFFTGEESGLLGAKHFIKHTQLPISTVINIDSLGFEPVLNKMRNGHKEPGNWLADLSAEVIKKHDVEIAWIAGGEDSFAFQAVNIPAIGLGQKPTERKERSIHTPDDDLEHLYLKPIQQGFKIFNEIIEILIQHPEKVVNFPFKKHQY
ncbi:M28 family metallopeptidase [Bacillus salitolerans]|uniref:M28 family metallopeptidase n=1 Tax=Bacillus salitolerans TaxID=1437434 RepID=A0ABW4LWW4_9BACI